MTLQTEIAARTAYAIDEALDQLNNGWTDHDVLMIMVDAWGAIQHLKDQADTEAGLDPLLCARCEQLIVRAHVTDADQVAWLGDNASKWCSDTCRDDDAQDYWTQRWTA